MTGLGGSDLRAPVFIGDNYEFWKIRMRTIFKSHGIWDLVEKGLGSSESKGKKVDEEGSSESEKVSLLMKDAKALGIIQGAVSDYIFPRISNEETSKGAWDVLHQEFHGVKLQGLRRDFEYTRMKDDETLSMYLTRLLELVNQMKGYGEDLSKGRLVQKLLISLTKEFDHVCYVIEKMKDIETIEVQEVLAALRGFAQRLDRHAESTTEKAFSSMSITKKDVSQILALVITNERRIGNRQVRNGIQNLKIMSTKEESMNKGKNQNKLRENASIVINYTMESVGLKGSQNAMVAIDLGTTLRTVIKQTRLEK
ncbi:hypothetical protein L3X38_037322 [Prunus dulcis]|uniref:DUF4219 domain-containing protein n=1 Tax=Prunus dulcis TaxID=3755 RepID=A0AAD4V355_PRUDU|nr:hypothetical protein L3X38_037322 [Prunus dulcis]